jgi:hypothetical protein
MTEIQQRFFDYIFKIVLDAQTAGKVSIDLNMGGHFNAAAELVGAVGEAKIALILFACEELERRKFVCEWDRQECFVNLNREHRRNLIVTKIATLEKEISDLKEDYKRWV